MNLPALVRNLPARLKGLFADTPSGLIPKNWSIAWWQEGRVPYTAGENAVVEACCQAYAQTLAMCPLEHTRDRPDNGRDHLTDSPVSRVLRSPNEHQTRSDLILNLVDSLEKTGNAYLWLGDRGIGEAVPRSLHLLNPRTTRAYRVEDGEVFYGISNDLWNTFTDIDMQAIAPARDIAHFKLHTPRDMLVGESPIRAAAASVATANAIQVNQANFFSNMSRPSGVLSAQMKLDAGQMKAMREAFDEQAKDINAGKIPILGGGLKWEPLTINSQDSELMTALRFTVEDIARAFRVPTPLIGGLENATLNNAETLVNFWLASGLGFAMTHVELVFEKAFQLPPGEHLNFDEKVLMRPDFKARIEAYGESTTKGIHAPNEVRKFEGLPAAKGGDEPRVQQQVVPLSYAAEKLAIEQAAARRPAAPPTSQDRELSAEVISLADRRSEKLKGHAHA